MRWNAIPRAATMPRCRSCSSAVPSCIRAWAIIRRWRNITGAPPEAELLSSLVAHAGHEHALCAVGDYEASERWYDELRQFALRCDRRDAGRPAGEKPAWPGWTFPCPSGRGGTDGDDPGGFPSHDGKEITLPPFSVTSTPAQHYERRERFF